MTLDVNYGYSPGDLDHPRGDIMLSDGRRIRITEWTPSKGHADIATVTIHGYLMAAPDASLEEMKRITKGYAQGALDRAQEKPDA